MRHAVHRFDDDLRRRVSSHLDGFERLAHPFENVANPGPALRHAAVAATLVPNEDGEACFLITRRAASLRAHAGQWALPGGSLDDGETPEDAALRELDEEVGLSLPRDAVLGRLDDYPTRSGYVITPVVVWAGGGHEPVPNPDEVAAIYCVRLAELDRPDVPILRAIAESDRPVLSVPLLGTTIHAPTAAVLYQLREVAIRGLSTRVHHYDQPVFAWS
ncbi:MAG: CoA pyrophosphatase [Myxococcales bacterium]|nr:CoA pyrophosphatase [Myxococcales bacterium]